MPEIRRPGFIERTAGTVSYWALLVVSRQAKKRGDIHEALHVAAAVVFGNNTHPTGQCPIPASYVEEAEALLAETKARG